MNINQEKGFVSLKLNSRHGELERRRRERQRSLAEIDSHIDATADITAENNKLEYNEERYRRREEAVQVGALFEVRWLLFLCKRNRIVFNETNSYNLFCCFYCL